MPNASRPDRLTRRGLLQGMACTAAVSWSLPAQGRTIGHLPRDYGARPLLGMDDLMPGDVLHLRVNGLFTSYHEVRPIIHAIQTRMLTSASRKRRSLYFHILRQHRALGLPAHDPIAGVDSLTYTVNDLVNTGHTTMYIGNGELIETTGEGCRLRLWQNIDTARYVVMRAKDPDHAALIAQFSHAIGGSTQARAVQDALGALREQLPPQDQAYIDALSAADCQADVADRYDMVTGSRGFFGKLKTRHHVASETPIDSMLYLDRQQPPVLHRDTICSSYAALVVNLCERARGWAEIGKTFDTSAMTPAQQERYQDLRRGVGCSVHVRPEWVLPAYLDLGMQVSGRFDIVGQFVNIGAAHNTEATPGAPVALARPHADYIDDTIEFVQGLTPEERRRIQMPTLPDPNHFVVTDEAILPHEDDLAKSEVLYRQLLTERAR